MIFSNRNRTAALVMGLLSGAPSIIAVLRGSTSAIPSQEGEKQELLDYEDRLASPRFLQEQVQCTDFDSVSTGLLNHELSDATCHENNCAGGCCRLYKWLICDRDNAFPDIPCVCNKNTQDVVEEVESTSAPTNFSKPSLSTTVDDSSSNSTEPAALSGGNFTGGMMDGIEISAELVVLKKAVNQSDTDSNNTVGFLDKDETEEGDLGDMEAEEDAKTFPPSSAPVTIIPTLAPTNNPSTGKPTLEPSTGTPTLAPTNPQTSLKLTLAPTQGPQQQPTTTTTVGNSIIESAVEVPGATACSGGSWYHDNGNFVAYKKCVHNSDCGQYEEDECCLKEYCFCGSTLQGDRNSLCV